MARRILSSPAIYRRFTQLVGGQVRETYAKNYVEASPGDRILDLGCGSGDILEFLPDVDYIGFDISARYINAAVRRFGHQGRFESKAIRDITVGDLHSFDRVLANGVLHHLDDADARQLLTVASNSLKDTGKLVTLDGCYVPSQSPIARLLLRVDRGKSVRTMEAYHELAATHFSDVRIHIRHDLLRVPYTHIIMECRKRTLTLR